MNEEERRRILFACLVFSIGLSITLVSGCGGIAPEAPSEVYLKFQDAIESGDYENLELALSRESLERLERWNAWAIIGKEDGLEKLSGFDRYMILLSRMLHDDLTKELWRALDRERRNQSRTYVINTLNSEALLFLLSDLRLGAIDSSGAVAGGPLYRGKMKFPAQARLIKEEGVWKVDLVAILYDLFKAEFARVSGDDFRNRNRVDELMKMLYGERFNKGLYVSPLEREE